MEEVEEKEEVEEVEKMRRWRRCSRFFLTPFSLSAFFHTHWDKNEQVLKRDGEEKRESEEEK